jgi:putative hydrolase of the HAD superfamily
MSTWPRVEAVDGVVEALAELGTGWTIALATNAADSEEAEIWSALALAGLDHLIDLVYCSRGVGHRKSAPEYFAHVLNDLGIRPDQAVMVGDDFEGDVRAANRAGIRAIWFRENGTEDSSDSMHRTVHRMRDLPEALELLSGELSGQAREPGKARGRHTCRKKNSETRGPAARP